ncbi:MAG: S8 family peptidase [Paludibacter sp.]|nr:S8 family peptidase [Paludibacter sp.]
MKNLLIILSIISVSAVFADDYYFYVQLTDKNNTPFSLANAPAFLSPDAIARRQRMNIAIDSSDFPVNPLYVEQVKNHSARIVGQSRWLNGLTVALTDSAQISTIETLHFVDFVKYTGKRGSTNGVQRSKQSGISRVTNNNTLPQLQQIKADYLHSLGYRGNGVKMAVIDAGFLHVDVNHAFDSLRNEGRLLGTRDFSDSNPNVFAGHYHGANVLSIIAGNLSDQFIGSAPDAQYLLLVSEYFPSEYPVETDFWVSAAEYADSAGVEIISSSLGYGVFTSDNSLSFKYQDMTGAVSRASRAATIASHKGIIVCSSAGNEGSTAWHYITSPGDADGIITVGAVTAAGNPSSFSSYGPSADNRIKPEIAAMGTSIVFVDNNGTLSSGNGTSYATPLVAGAVASFLQYVKANFATYSVAAIRDAIIKSANHYDSPTAQSGYGIPDFQVAKTNIDSILPPKNNNSPEKKFFFSISDKCLHIAKDLSENTVHIFSVDGKMLYSKNNVNDKISLADLAKGCYIVRLKSQNFVDSQIIIIE